MSLTNLLTLKITVDFIDYFVENNLCNDFITMLKPLFDNLDDEQVDNDNQDSLLSKYFPALKGIKDDKNIFI